LENLHQSFRSFIVAMAPHTGHVVSLKNRIYWQHVQKEYNPTHSEARQDLQISEEEGRNFEERRVQYVSRQRYVLHTSFLETNID